MVAVAPVGRGEVDGHRPVFVWAVTLMRPDTPAGFSSKKPSRWCAEIDQKASTPAPETGAGGR
jgi:hypothetical protein